MDSLLFTVEGKLFQEPLRGDERMKDNENSNTAASQVDAQERLKTAAIAMASNAKLHATDKGGEKGSSDFADMKEVEKIINDWPAMSKKAAKQTIDFYGPPNEAAPTQLTWYYNRPWKRTVVHREEIPHDFPQPHSDVIEQFIDYVVPLEKLSEVSKFDGSVVVERTKGEVSSCCDIEAANVVALNMMHEIVTGKKSAEEARQTLTEQMAAYVMNQPAPYAEAFQFDVPLEEKFDTDEVTMKDEAITQAIKKAKEKF